MLWASGTNISVTWMSLLPEPDSPATFHTSMIS